MFAMTIKKTHAHTDTLHWRIFLNVFNFKIKCSGAIVYKRECSEDICLFL